MTDFGIRLEEDALDRIHVALSTHPQGMLVGAIADATGLGHGYVKALLEKSDCVLKKRAGSYKWLADWSDLPENFRPA